MTTEHAAIVVEHVGKRFRLKASGTRTLKATVLDALRARRRSRWFDALTDVSFTVSRGETLGIIGPNGAGKSTLLALVAGTMAPTGGVIRTFGTVSSLLELGAGFHPDLTGRENVFLYGAILGIPRAKMAERYPAVESFADIGPYMDQPVKHYSSGMYVRLAFAVAVEVDPDILLIDEVLAVGDVAFQRKCLQKMREFRERRKTMLMVSHDLTAIQSVSDRILVLDAGRVVGLGNPSDMVESYRARLGQSHREGMSREWGTGEARFRSVRFLNEQGRPTTTVGWGKDLLIELDYQATRRIERPVFGFAISTADGHRVHGSNTQLARVPIPHIEGRGTMRLKLPRMALGNGVYLFSFSLHSEDHTLNYHRLDHCFSVSVVDAPACDGVCTMPSEWQVG